ncbi:MAG: septum formation initiator family protein [bacterium]
MRVLAAAAVLALPAILYVGQSTQAARAGYDILALREDVGALQAEHARLLARVTSLKSPKRIEQAAVEDLGMIKPDPKQMTAIILPPATLTIQPVARPTMWQRLGALLLRREAQAAESR